MHTKKFIDENGYEWFVHHNGDFSGDLTIVFPSNYVQAADRLPIENDPITNATWIHVPAKIFEMMNDSKVASEVQSFLEDNYF